MSTQPLQAAVAISREVLANVKADQLTDATPCANWDVKGLINHIVGAQMFFESGISGGAPSGIETDFAAGDYLGAYDAESAKCIAAFSGDGVMEKMFTLPFGQMPGAAFMGLAMTDTFQHAWDLAKATGQDTNLAPQLAEQLLAGARQSIQPGFRSDDGAVFGPEQQAPEGASAADQLAAFLGRSV